eukprot:2987104-Pyramimonas_sp.AAC.1
MYQSPFPLPPHAHQTAIRANCPTICKCEFRNAGETREGGAPSGATNRARGVPELAGGRMRTLLQEPQVELLVGPRSV